MRTLQRKTPVGCALLFSVAGLGPSGLSAAVGCSSEEFAQCEQARTCGALADSGPDAVGAPDGAGESDAACTFPFADCNGMAADGCETDVTLDPDHCGTCGRECSGDGVAARQCEQGVCAPECSAGRGDCSTPASAEADDGCETDLTTNADHCGACDRACSARSVATRQCTQAECAPECLAGYDDCGTPAVTAADDGCEANLATDPDHCGACGQVCGEGQVMDRVCTASACSPVCAPGFADCSGGGSLPDDGCETDLNQPESCGACGKSCEGGGCSGELCEPVPLGEPALIVHNAAISSSVIALDEAYVYFVDSGVQGGVSRVLKSGSANPEVLVSGEIYTSGVAVDEQYVYWTSAPGEIGAVRRKPLAGTATVQNIYLPPPPVPVFPYSIKVSATHVAWSNQMDPAVMSAPKSSILPRPPLSNTAGRVAVDTAHVYWATGAALLRIPVDGGTEAPIDTGTGINDVALDDTYVYWASDGEIIRELKTGSGRETLTADVLEHLTADGTGVYYATTTEVKHVPLAGGEPIPRASGVTVMDIEVDADHVYWIQNGTATAQVMKMVK